MERRTAEGSTGFGKILDIPFPAIPAMATTAEVVSMAEYWTEKIQRIRPECIMCQGEFTFTMAVIWRLQKEGIRCVTACTERIAAEEPVRDGLWRRRPHLNSGSFANMKKWVFIWR